MALEKKQKILIPLVVIAFAVLGWESYNMLSDDDDGYSSPPSVPENVAHTQRPVPVPRQGSFNSTLQSIDTMRDQTQDAAISMSTHDSNSVDHHQKAADSKSSATQTGLTPQQQAQIAAQQAREQQYIKMVNQYQLAQMQKKLADVNAQLAQARLKEAQALAKVTQQNLPIPTHFTTDVTTQSAPHINVLSTYQVLYVSYVNNRWMATIKHAGQLHNVYIGSQFNDGTVVRVIDRNGIVLEYNGRSRYLTIPIPMTVDEKENVHNVTGANISSSGYAAKPTVDATTQTADSADEVYHTLSKIQQAMPQK